jgi:RNA polymerase sigma-70 factor (ECF subfamily)
VTPEERIAEALARGDQEAAAEALLRALGPQILGYLTRVLGSADDAADAFSYFAEDVWKGIRTFRGESSVRVWTYRVAWNAAARVGRDAWRRRRERFPTTMASRIAADVLSRSPGSVEREAAEVNALRGQLEPEEQSLLVLRLDRGLSWKEVAEVMAEEGKPADEAALRKRFERVKLRIGKLARKRGLLD